MSGRPTRKPVEAFDADMPDHATMDAELVAAAESRPECPRENYTAVTTSAEGHKDATEALGGQHGAFPAVWWSPSGTSPESPARQEGDR